MPAWSFPAVPRLGEPFGEHSFKVHFPVCLNNPTMVDARKVHVHVHVQLPSRQDAQPPVPWRDTVEGADIARKVLFTEHARAVCHSSFGVSTRLQPP